MQALFTLILTYNIYFGCLPCEILRFSKLYTVRACTITPPRNNVISRITGLGDERSNDSNHYWDTRLHYCSMRRSAIDSAELKSEKLISGRYLKNAKRRECSYFRLGTNRIYRRKLLGYERNFHKRFLKRQKSPGTSIIRRLRLIEKKRDISAAQEIIPNDDTDSEAWDNWSNWSTCSVTCGLGQQVRWRHCSSGDCIKGLKKAQLKSCRLKDCHTKGFLGWLGIKTRSV